MTADPAIHAAAHKLFSFTRVWAIAANTFRDLVRQKVFYFMLVFALILIGASLALASINSRGQLQTVIDVSLGAMGVFSILLAVLATAMLLPKDIEDRTLYTILAKPVARFEYLAGKLLGVVGILALAIVLMAGVFCIVLWYWRGREIAAIPFYYDPAEAAQRIELVRSGTFTPSLFGGVFVVLLRSIVCAALTLMISCFATSWLFTVIVSFAAVIIGHLVAIARNVWQNPASFGVDPPWYMDGFLRLVTVAFPDMQIFNIVDEIALGTNVAPAIFATIAGLSAGYIAVYLLVGYVFFIWREL